MLAGRYSMTLHGPVIGASPRDFAVEIYRKLRTIDRRDAGLRITPRGSR